MSDSIMQETTVAQPEPAPGLPGPAPDAPGGIGLDSVMSIPVNVQVILGTTRVPVSRLMQLSRGSIVPLDQKVGEPVEVVVNGRVVARGELIVLDDDSSRFGVALTEIVPARPAGLAG